MIRIILDALKLAEFGKSELIDIAKGKYEIPNNLKKFKRQIKWQSKG